MSWNFLDAINEHINKYLIRKQCQKDINENKFVYLDTGVSIDLRKEKQRYLKIKQMKEEREKLLKQLKDLDIPMPKENNNADPVKINSRYVIKKGDEKYRLLLEKKNSISRKNKELVEKSGSLANKLLYNQKQYPSYLYEEIEEFVPRKITSRFIIQLLNECVNHANKMLEKKKYWVNFHDDSFLFGHRYQSYNILSDAIEKEIRLLKATLEDDNQEYRVKIESLQKDYDRFKNNNAVHNAQNCLEIEKKLRRQFHDSAAKSRKRIIILLSEKQNMIKRVNKDISVYNKEILRRVDWYFFGASDLNPEIFPFKYTQEDYEKMCGSKLSGDFTGEEADVERRLNEINNMTYISPNLTIKE